MQHNLSKLAQSIAYNSIYKYDFICFMSETYLDYATPDSFLELEGSRIIPILSKEVEFAFTTRSYPLFEL